MAASATLTALRDRDTENAIVFVHGFGGDPTITWGELPKFLMGNKVLKGWDVYCLGYSSRLAPDFRGLWSGDPDIQRISTYLFTQTVMGTLKKYKALALVAHSMGGLVVQRALLDREDLLHRTSHVFLFGTPSDGLKKAGWFSWFKRQVQDMKHNGAFIKRLRSDWKKKWPQQPPPHFWTIAGDKDEFVPAWSSLSPFPQEQQLVVPGNHLEIVKPDKKKHLSVQVVLRGIQGDAAPGGPANAASVALEMLEFARAVETFEKHADELDEAHLVQLAIALEGLGETRKALETLERAGKRGTDAQGVLAGRLKRRWITEGRKSDYDRALELYSSAYEEACDQGDHQQAFYHGINVCFLLSAGSGKKKKEVQRLAKEVLEHCDQAPEDFWCRGTRGEAHLYLGNRDQALAEYRKAVGMKRAPKPWMLKSMHSQASQLAAILDKDDLLPELDQVFQQG